MFLGGKLSGPLRRAERGGREHLTGQGAQEREPHSGDSYRRVCESVDAPRTRQTVRRCELVWLTTMPSTCICSSRRFV